MCINIVPIQVYVAKSATIYLTEFCLEAFLLNTSVKCIAIVQHALFGML